MPSLRCASRLVALLLYALLLGGASADQPTSVYSSTKAGVILDQSTPKDPGDFFIKRCKGHGGYDLLFKGDDARSWIDLLCGKTEVSLRAETFKLSPGSFPNKANDVVEWRGVTKNGRFAPYALIYRLSGVDEDHDRKSKSRLIVIKLSGADSKVVGFAEGRNEDEEARRLADQCKSEKDAH